ncbi:AbrB/MazE/SpoVT family DNA-binding domain-containing protein [Paucilactobacillus wasatchensis]|uniref:AbrB/MazE/SpoVT family DNA-binding domain-containing protein n=1 Tax=Paucilactobacillus wasatchensis TaxID=1335616 RepID=UPI0005C6BEAA|nr:AbrB/MazE/SpoVT family DNA-binding domain-containing protein [Paucilactobacillus wasatchensis]
MDRSKKQTFRKIGKTGNSLTITIPTEISKELNLNKGDIIGISTQGHDIKLETNVQPPVTTNDVQDINDLIAEYHETMNILKER